MRMEGDVSVGGDPIWSPVPEGRHRGLPLHRNVILIQFGIETYDE